MLFGLRQLPTHTCYQEAKTLFCLTYPMFLAQGIQVSIGFAEILIISPLGQEATAALSIGSTIFFTVWVMLLGAISSVSAIVARQYGQQVAPYSVGQVGQQALWYGLLLSVVGILLLSGMTQLLDRYLNMPQSIINETVLFINVIMLGLPGSMLYLAATEYTASLSRTKIIMMTNLCGLFVNILLDYILVHGLWNAPQMGVCGCAAGRAITYWFNSAFILFYISRHTGYKPFGLFRCFARPHIQVIFHLLRIGFFSGLSYLLEICLITAATVIGTHFGAAYVVSQNIVINFCSILYMLPQSFSIALSIRISEKIGQNQLQDARALCGIGLLVSLMLALIFSIVIWIMRYPIMDLYSNDTSVIAIGASLLWLGALFLAFNDVQTVASGALRGYKKTMNALFIHLITYLGIGIPLAYCLALPTPLNQWFGHVLTIGWQGTWIGIVAGLLTASIALFIYLSYVTRREKIN
ncbi:MAG: MATE family efflux transporter [Neisseriales bacterium]|nr:MAG: MATE family efflux transporter [Neisseriales bacterium]